MSLIDVAHTIYIEWVSSTIINNFYKYFTFNLNFKNYKFSKFALTGHIDIIITKILAQKLEDNFIFN